MGSEETRESRVPRLNSLTVKLEKELESLSTRELVAFLQSSFRKDEFEAVAAILVSRERRIYDKLSLREAEKARLEEKAERENHRLGSAVVELEDGLRTETERLASEKNAMSEELEKYKKKCGDLEEGIACAEERFRLVYLGRQLRAQLRARRRINGLEDALERKKREVSSKEALEIELEAKCNELEKELVVYKRKCLELEGNVREGVSGSVVAVSELKAKLKELEDVFASMEVKFEKVRHEKLALAKELEMYKRMCGKHEQLMARMEEENGSVREREWKMQERIAELMQKLEMKEKEAKEGLLKIAAGNKDGVEEWKRKYGEVEARALGLIGENMELKEKVKMAENEQGNKQSCASAGDQSNTRMKEENAIMLAREQEAQKRIAELMQELERKEEEAKKRLLELEARNKDEVDEWKRKCRQVEDRALQFLEENVALSEMLDIIENEQGNKKSGVSTGDQNSMRIKEDNTMVPMREQEAQERIAELMRELKKKEKEAKELEKKEKEAKERLLELEARNEADEWKRKYREVDAWALQLLKANMALNEKLEMLKNKQGSKQSSASSGDQNREHCEYPMRIKPSLEQGMSLERRGGPTIEEKIVEISDSEDEVIVEADVLRDSAIEELAGTKNDATSQMFSDQRDLNAVKDDQRDNAIKDDSRSSEESFHFTATSTRKRVSRTVISSNSEYDDDVRILPGQLQKKRLVEVVEGSNQLDDSSVKYSFGCENIRDTVESPENHLIHQPQHEVWATGTSNGALDSRIRPPSNTNYMILSDGGNVHRKLKSQYIGEAGENKVFGRKGVDDVRSGNDSERLDGCSVTSSAGTESPYNYNEASRRVTDNSEIDKTMAENPQESDSRRWKYETDMLFSLGEDPVLCMQAVCAIYRQQMSQEKSVKGTVYSRNHGFKPFDAYKGTKMAEFLMDGNPHGPLKKTAQELKNHDLKGLDYCRKLATDYSNQLFMIYQSKSDLFFSS